MFLLDFLISGPRYIDWNKPKEELDPEVVLEGHFIFLLVFSSIVRLLAWACLVFSIVGQLALGWLGFRDS